MIRALRHLLGALLLLAAGVAGAQTLDDIDVRTQGDQKVVRLRFNASVSYITIAPAGAADQYQLRFEMLAADEPVLRQVAGEQRRLAAGDGLPGIAVSYTPEPGNRIKQLTVRLGRALPLTARQGPNARSIELLISAKAPEPAAGAASAPEAMELANGGANAAPEVEAQAQALMTQARAAVAERRADDAVRALDQLLKLPPNSQSTEAQELIGQAWEAADNPGRARIEYTLYLKLYPTGEGAARVNARLIALGGAPVAAAPAASTPAPAPVPAKTFSGSIAQYYYGGKAKSDSLVTIATGIDQATLSKTTESALVTSFDLSGRFVDEGSETRAVLRGSGTKNLIQDGRSSSSVSAAYVDHRFGAGGTLGGLAVRAGRQSPISGGLLGLFDGVSLAYPVREGIKLDVMGGTPAGALISAPSERLFATVLEVDTFLERFGGNFYVLQQTTQGITNRRALGGELRYAGDRWSLNTLADYESVTRKLNALSVHTSWQLPGQTTLTVLGDQRRAPSLQLTNALISSGADSLKTLLDQGRTLDEIRQRAIDTSATARQFLISVARPLSPQWQVSTDLRYSAVGALPAVDNFQATPATGAQYSFSAQATGTNLYSKRDINNFNLSIITTPFFKGTQFSYNNLSGLADNQDLTLEPSIRLYTQSDKQDVKITRVGPGMRVTYRTTRRASLLGELLYEVSRTRGPTNRDDSSSAFFYVGYRYELF